MNASLASKAWAGGNSGCALTALASCWRQVSRSRFWKLLIASLTSTMLLESSSTSAAKGDETPFEGNWVIVPARAETAAASVIAKAAQNVRLPIRFPRPLRTVFIPGPPPVVSSTEPLTAARFRVRTGPRRRGRSERSSEPNGSLSWCSVEVESDQEERAVSNTEKDPIGLVAERPPGIGRFRDCAILRLLHLLLHQPSTQETHPSPNDRWQFLMTGLMSSLNEGRITVPMANLARKITKLTLECSFLAT